MEQYLNYPFFKNEKTTNIINLIYDINEGSYFDWLGYKIDKVNILGKKFVENYKNNFELIINRVKCEFLIVKIKYK